LTQIRNGSASLKLLVPPVQKGVRHPLMEMRRPSPAEISMGAMLLTARNPKESLMPRTTIRNALAAVVIILLTCVAPVLSEETHTHDSGAAMKPPARMPFLVAGKMPHLTGILKQHWDDPELKLTAEQKAVLLEIRKNTISAVMDLAEELDQLESSLAEQAMDATPPDQLAPLVDTISDLKTEATMVHLRCIHDTIEILDDRQLTTLLDMSGTP